MSCSFCNHPRLAGVLTRAKSCRNLTASQLVGIRGCRGRSTCLRRSIYDYISKADPTTMTMIAIPMHLGLSCTIIVQHYQPFYYDACQPMLANLTQSYHKLLAFLVSSSTRRYRRFEHQGGDLRPIPSQHLFTHSLHVPPYDTVVVIFSIGA